MKYTSTDRTFTTNIKCIKKTIAFILSNIQTSRNRTGSFARQIQGPTGIYETDERNFVV